MTIKDPNTPMAYKDAGVDIDAGSRLIEEIKPVAKATFRPGVLAGLGGFGALFELPLDRYQHPVLVSGTDGVGTKLKIATELNRHQHIGIDLVAMCANDLIVQGAEPLFFLDYFATGKLDVNTATTVIQGIGAGCQQAGIALIGGETAEMPGMYQDGDYDLAGFCVGVVERDKIIDGSQVKSGDALIALASSGPHANGYSLIRKILEQQQIDLEQAFSANQTLGDTLLTPTRIYVAAILSLLSRQTVHALCHITGGGLTENLPRVIPAHLCAILQPWTQPPIFQWLQKQGHIALNEMRRTFNCGIGMVLCLPETDVDQALEHLTEQGETAWKLGYIQERMPGQDTVDFAHEQ